MPTTDGAHAESGAASALTVLTDAELGMAIRAIERWEAAVTDSEQQELEDAHNHLKQAKMFYFADAIRGLMAAREALRVAAAEREALREALECIASGSYERYAVTKAREALAPLAPQPAGAPAGEAGDGARKEGTGTL